MAIDFDTVAAVVDETAAGPKVITSIGAVFGGAVLNVHKLLNIE